MTGIVIIQSSAIGTVDIVSCILDTLCRPIRDVQYHEISATFSCLSSARLVNERQIGITLGVLHIYDRWDSIV